MQFASSVCNTENRLRFKRKEKKKKHNLLMFASAFPCYVVLCSCATVCVCVCGDIFFCDVVTGHEKGPDSFESAQTNQTESVDRNVLSDLLNAIAPDCAFLCCWCLVFRGSLPFAANPFQICDCLIGDDAGVFQLRAIFFLSSYSSMVQAS